VSVSILFSACSTDKPADPANAPAPTPVIIAPGTVISDFEDMTLDVTLSAVSGTWASGNDSADGGESIVNSFNASATPGAAVGNFSLHTNATLKTRIAYPGASGGYTSQAPEPDKIGYVTNSLVLDGPISLTRSAYVAWYHLFSTSGPSVNVKVFIYNTKNQYIYSPLITSSGTWAFREALFANCYLPAGASYTRDDVLSSVKKIVWVYRYMRYGNYDDDFDINIDNVFVHNVM